MFFRGVNSLLNFRGGFFHVFFLSQPGMASCEVDDIFSICQMEMKSVKLRLEVIEFAFLFLTPKIADGSSYTDADRPFRPWPLRSGGKVDG